MRETIVFTLIVLIWLAAVVTLFVVLPGLAIMNGEWPVAVVLWLLASFALFNGLRR